MQQKIYICCVYQCASCTRSVTESLMLSILYNYNTHWYYAQEKWNQIFIRSSEDEFALHLCLYCTCIQLTFSVNSYPVKFLNQPNEFLNKIYKQNCSEYSQWPEVCHHLLSQLLHCKNALADYTQTQILRALDSGVLCTVLRVTWLLVYVAGASNVIL